VAKSAVATSLVPAAKAENKEPSRVTAVVPVARVGVPLLLKTILPRPVAVAGASSWTNPSQYNDARFDAQREGGYKSQRTRASARVRTCSSHWLLASSLAQELEADLYSGQCAC